MGEPGEIAAVVVGGIDVAWLGARLRERNLAQGSALAVADGDGTILAREPDPERYVGQKISAPFLPLVHADRPGTLEIAGSDGTRRILGYQPASATETGLYVGASFSSRTVFGPIYASTLRSIALAAAGRAGRLRRRLVRRRPAVPQADPAHPRHDRQLARRRRIGARPGSPPAAASSASSRERSTSTWTDWSPPAPSAPSPRSGGRWCCTR